MIGKGGSSRVYKGCLQDGKEIAVKILKQTEDVLKEFVLEIEIIMKLNHKNIISLFGFCFDAVHLVLVYDLIARGSLEENLYGTKISSSFHPHLNLVKILTSAAYLVLFHNVYLIR